MADPAPILAFEELDSTNAEARRRAETGEAGPLWITAARQTAGRGRRGRVWETGQGNLAATHLFVTDKAPAEAAQVSFVAALAVVDLAVRYFRPGRISVKWPNDVMIDGAKSAGILVESGLAAAGLWIAVGFGVNLATPPVASECPATAFAIHLSELPPTPSQALAVLAERFAHWSLMWERGGFGGAIRSVWSAYAQGLGQRCTVRLASETIEGVAEGLDPTGALRLRGADGTVRLITAGDVFF